MVEALAELYPGARVWPSTDVKDSGLEFWAKMQDRLGIRLGHRNIDGAEILSDEVVEDRVDGLRRAEEMYGEGYFHPARQAAAHVGPAPWRKRRRALRIAREIHASARRTEEATTSPAHTDEP